MYVCMHVCKYIRTYVCMYVCMFVCMYYLIADICCGTGSIGLTLAKVCHPQLLLHAYICIYVHVFTVFLSPYSYQLGFLNFLDNLCICPQV